MATIGDVLDAIGRIRAAGHTAEATRALLDVSTRIRSAGEYDEVLKRLRADFPDVFPASPRAGAPQQSQPGPAPGESTGQQGEAARAMKDAEIALSQQQSAAAEFDRQVIEALLHAHNTTQEGGRRLAEVQTQIESAARTWDLSTAAGAREFQKYLIGRLREIVAVVQDANDDDTSKQAMAAAWTALYASVARQDGRSGDGDAPQGGAGAREDDDTPYPEEFPGSGMDPYVDALPGDDFGSPAQSASPYGPPVAPAMPPGAGEAAPGAGPMPVAGLPAGLPPGGLLPGGLLPGLQGGPPPQHLGEELPPPVDPDPAAEPPTGRAAPDDGDGDGDGDTTPQPEPTAGATTVTLPDGETVTAATPQLAAVIAAAAGGTPIPDAFRAQGIDIPPPGTAVTGPLDPARVIPADIGMFIDRHALALGNSRALLDGQIQDIANVRGPSFLGWQHPPTAGEKAATGPTPTPTRPSEVVRVRT